jgi:transposase
MRNGSEWRRFFLASPVIQAGRQRITGCFWRRCSGWRGPARHGVTFQTKFGNWNSTFKRFRRIEIDALIGDKGFDNDWLRKELDERGAIAVIPPKADRRTAIACDFAMYRWRHLVENFFCDLKQYRRIATRYDKTDHSFAAMINLAATVMALK